MKLPQVKQRVILLTTAFVVDDDYNDEDQAWEDEITDSSEVTVLARDLEEGIWTVWNHDVKAIQMITFDENANWRVVEPTPEVTDDQA